MQPEAEGGARPKVALVVGAGDFIGAAIARRFAAGGFTVAVGRRTADKLAPLVGEQAQRDWLLFAADLSPEEIGAIRGWAIKIELESTGAVSGLVEEMRENVRDRRRSG